MKKGVLSREEAINIAGLNAVEILDNENCEPTNRVGYLFGDDEIEFSASVSIEDGILKAYYYQDAESVKENELDCLDWEIHGYEIF